MPHKVILNHRGKLNWSSVIFCLWATLITYSAVSYTYKFQTQSFHCYGEKHVIYTNSQ